MFYTTAWCTGNEASFRKSIPLEALGASMRQYGSTMPFTIVMLEGMQHLSGGYVRALESLGFTLVDYQGAFEGIVRDYPAIDKHYSRYERNCLLRWIAIKQLASRRMAQCWHLDGDVVLHTSLDDLAADTAGKTFMLQGCPVLVSIADFSWFDRYEENLRALHADIAGYSEHAWAQREECRQRDAVLANQTLYRNPIGSDQDLLEYLVSAQRIPQAPASTIFDSRYYFIQNGLIADHWHTAQYRPAATGPAGLSLGSPRFTMDKNLRIHIGSKLVPFTHFQNTFSLYCGVYLTLRQLRVPGAIVRRILRFNVHDEAFRVGFLFKVIGKMNARRPSFNRRDGIIRRMMQSPSPPLPGVLNGLLNRESS